MRVFFAIAQLHKVRLEQNFLSLNKLLILLKYKNKLRIGDSLTFNEQAFKTKQTIWFT
jgi:hypothetical protein